jgi:hypothetical protein
MTEIIITPLPFVQNDGGRADAGYRGTTGDCVARAIAIATGMPYQEVYDGINAEARKERRSSGKCGKSSARTGVHKGTIVRYLTSLGWVFTPTMAIGSGCTHHLRKGEVPMGRLIASLSRHYAAVIDGVVHDTHDPTRGGTRCLYGYWTKG